MIIQIGTDVDESRILWKYKESDEWKRADIDDLIRAYEKYNRLTTIDVVRCKDCRHCSEHYDRDGYPYWICDEWDSGTDVDGFCHYGERREP